MTTLNQAYTKHKEFNLMVKKNYSAPLPSIYIEPNFNIRDINQDHVNQLVEAYRNGDHVPAIIVIVTEKGLQVVDGHHRYLAACLLQTETGLEIRLQVTEFAGTLLEALALQVKSSQGLNLDPLDRAKAYNRMINQGATKEEIAKLVGRSVTDIANMIDLAHCAPSIKESVKAGEISYTTALKVQKEHGVNAASVIRKAVDDLPDGKKKVVVKKVNYKKLLEKAIAYAKAIRTNLNTLSHISRSDLPSDVYVGLSEYDYELLDEVLESIIFVESEDT